MERKGSPQLEEGHTRLADELLEALMRMPLLDRKSRIIFCLLRFSFGCGNKLAMLTSSDISLMTNIAKPNVITALNEMSGTRIIFWDKKNNLIQFNKHYREWNLGKNPDWFDISKNLASILKKNIDLAVTLKARGIESIALESIAIDLIPPEQKKSLAGIPVDTTTGIHGDTGDETGRYRFNTQSGIESIPINPSQPTTGAAFTPPKYILKTTSSTPPTLTEKFPYPQPPLTQVSLPTRVRGLP